MPGPEVIGADLENFKQRAGHFAVGELSRAPTFDSSRERVRGEPMSCQGNAAFGMVGGTLAVKTPGLARQHAVREFFALAPPIVPNGTEVAVRAGLGAGQFSGQETGTTQQACLQGERGTSSLKPTLATFRQALHGPDIVLVTERAEDAFPECLFPADVPGTSLKAAGFGTKTDLSRLQQQFTELVQ